MQTEPLYYKDRLEEEIQGSIKKIDDKRTKKGERKRSTEERGGEERTGEKRG